MKIKSTVAEATKYGDDALEAFYTAVDNGQARLALLILTDVVKAFEERFDALDSEDNLVEQTPAIEEVKVEEVKVVEEQEAKQENVTKAKSSEKTSKE